MSTPALEISGLHAWYGESHILHDISLVVQPGEVVTLLGRNGAGRTTTLRAIMGLTGARKGSIKINGREAIGLPTYKVAHLGVGYCPEERGIFSSLSTEENLMLPPFVSKTERGMSVRMKNVSVAGSYTSTTLVLGAPPIAYSFPLTAAAARMARG